MTPYSSLQQHVRIIVHHFIFIGLGAVAKAAAIANVIDYLYVYIVNANVSFRNLIIHKVLSIELKDFVYKMCYVLNLTQEFLNGIPVFMDSKYYLTVLIGYFIFKLDFHGLSFCLYWAYIVTGTWFLILFLPTQWK